MDSILGNADPELIAQQVMCTSIQALQFIYPMNCRDMKTLSAENYLL